MQKKNILISAVRGNFSRLLMKMRESWKRKVDNLN